MQDSWETRFEWIQTILQWTALVIGVGLTVLQFGMTAGTVAASTAVAAYTIAMQVIPRRAKELPLVAALLALLGVATALLAINLTGGLDSAFLIYLAVPVFFASAFHGMVLGGATTLAAIAGLVATVSATGGDPLSADLLTMVTFYALIGIAFAQANRILIEEPHADPANAQFERLMTAHTLLADLVVLASSAELNPVEIGRSALRDLAVTVPYSAGTILILDDGEDLVVATRGHPGSDASCLEYDICLQDHRLGKLRLWPVADAAEQTHDEEIERSMQSVALAFDNVLLLQTIAHRAVREERMRLARELHDDIGPTLVSIGLGMDLLTNQAEIDPESVKRLQELRESIRDLVDEVRVTVTHLRSSETSSLSEHAHALAADAPVDGPAFDISINESGTIDRRTSTELAAIMTEAVRNAVEHAGASLVAIDGTVDRDRCRLRISDNGRGIDPRNPVGAHYGLVGMEERAAQIGAVIRIESARGRGTTIEITWGRP
ncbi:MAG: histidine kinase [Actinomycetota bacterium]|nr:histidine kinase [Actinomycetota bacterium]